ncbi:MULTISPECIES: cysteine peptidase family C39 domain-containing protein [Flavobacterium]|uniref:cysteine peptidase family C39 domain-containing protein n=1 Tax=Flavobacterium TaxID=237 RepID=UPI001F0C16DB|nr:cysteine peptidase family C39 domain-containing protein [Flavobacterium columnare]
MFFLLIHKKYFLFESLKTFPNYKQADNKNCRPTCIKIISKHYGKTISTQTLRDYCETNREGSNLLY